ncbi:hypothetical protein DY000_02017763 [Brassica cretica]|uniref:Uncharacterized protein n=1 Tax=Brassica cretica TaxID=69181 RepID=A0ABQ7D543_BRACR|nr:hypothetical protein DY000_02017763 [Brassica cretica]
MQRPNACSARSLRNDRASVPLGRYVAIELEPRSVASYRPSVRPARSLRSDRAEQPLGRSVATELFRYIGTTITPCILVYPSMLSPGHHSEPISCFPPF